MSQNDDMNEQESEETIVAQEDAPEIEGHDGDEAEGGDSPNSAADAVDASDEASTPDDSSDDGVVVLEILPPDGSDEDDDGGEDEDEEVVEVIDIGEAKAKPVAPPISGIPASKLPGLGAKKPAKPVDPAQLRAIQEQLGASLRSAREESAAAQERVAELEARLVEQEEASATERDDLRNKMMRAVADKDNYRKRAEREKTEAKKYAAKSLVNDLLQAVDNLERALAHADRTEEESSISEGVRMVHRQILTALERNGVTGYDSLGEAFDPQRHEAVQQRDSTEHATGTVVEEFQRGYFIHERLLRAALVVVARYVGEEVPPAADEAATLSDVPPMDPAPVDDPTDPEDVSDEASDDVSEDAPEGAPEDASEEATEDTLGDDVSEAKA